MQPNYVLFYLSAKNGKEREAIIREINALSQNEQMRIYTLIRETVALANMKV